MLTYIIRRIILSVIVLLLVTITVFLAMRILPGDPIYMIMTQGQVTDTSVEQIEAVRHEFGLDKPVVAQYLDWLTGLFQGNLGKSIVLSKTVLSIFAEALPKTLEMGLLAFIISFIIGITVGVISAVRWGTWVDTVSTVFANVGITVPIFWLGIILIYLFSLKLGWLPVQGYTSPFEDLLKNVRQMVMPVFCLSIFPVASLARQTRSSMLEVMQQDYIRTAWSKGLKEGTIIFNHALKNGLIPVITLAGISLSHIIGGSVFIETVFNIRGVGLILVSAVFAHDYTIVQGFVLFIAIAILFINLVVDISYAWLDPRIRYT